MPDSEDTSGSPRPDARSQSQRQMPVFLPKSPRQLLPPIPLPSGERLAKLAAWSRRSLGLGVMHASAPLRGTAPSDRAYARAQLETVRIEEKYYYEQDIAQNGDQRKGQDPTGEIELVLPYDGDKYLTRKAYADISRGRDDQSEQARVGYLTLTDYENTDLDDVLMLAGTYGSFPVDVPLGLRPEPGEPDELIADRSICRMSCDYRPATKLREIHPLDIRLELRDPDTAEFSHTTKLQDSGTARQQIMKHVSFKPDLLLGAVVRLHLPRALAEGATASVSRVALKWPTHTSLGLLALTVNRKPNPLRYNPVEQALEWFDVPMKSEPDAGNSDFVTLSSPLMDLSIPQPGELYKRKGLTGCVEVTIDRLLSGTDARFFDATGRRDDRLKLELKSIVACEFTFILDDAFSRRMLTPYQQMHFDEVVLSDMRIDDIKSALVNLGYKCRDLSSIFSDEERRWIKASRTEGPETLWLDLYVEGKRYKARRRRQVPGGLTYQTNLESGELRIYIYGALPRDSQPIVHDMNALRRALGERFDRLPARR